eukprot:229530-Amphidinium_carterae.1
MWRGHRTSPQCGHVTAPPLPMITPSSSKSDKTHPKSAPPLSESIYNTAVMAMTRALRLTDLVCTCTAITRSVYASVARLAWEVDARAVTRLGNFSFLCKTFCLGAAYRSLKSSFDPGKGQLSMRCSVDPHTAHLCTCRRILCFGTGLLFPIFYVCEITQL